MQDALDGLPVFHAVDGSRVILLDPPQIAAEGRAQGDQAARQLLEALALAATRLESAADNGLGRILLAAERLLQRFHGTGPAPEGLRDRLQRAAARLQVLVHLGTRRLAVRARHERARLARRAVIPRVVRAPRRARGRARRFQRAARRAAGGGSSGDDSGPSDPDPPPPSLIFSAGSRRPLEVPRA